MTAESAKKYMENAVDKILRDAATETYKELVELTPVDTGRARAGWNMQRGTPDASVPAPGKKQYPKPETPELAPALPGESSTIYISSAIPYILPLNEGTSEQAPKRFVQAAIARGLAKIRR